MAWRNLLIGLFARTDSRPSPPGTRAASFRLLAGFSISSRFLEFSGASSLDGTHETLRIGGAAQQMQRLDHALVLVRGHHDDSARILARDVERRAAVAHLLHILRELFLRRSEYETWLMTTPRYCTHIRTNDESRADGRRRRESSRKRSLNGFFLSSFRGQLVGSRNVCCVTPGFRRTGELYASYLCALFSRSGVWSRWPGCPSSPRRLQDRPPGAGAKTRRRQPIPTSPAARQSPPTTNLAVKDALLGGEPGDDLSSASATTASATTASPSSISAARSRRLPRDGEGWLGLAASYDRLKRYVSPTAPTARRSPIFGPRPEVINNIGYSFLLRGDLRRARQKFAEAQRQDPENPTIANNIALVDEAAQAQEGPELRVSQVEHDHFAKTACTLFAIMPQPDHARLRPRKRISRFSPRVLRLPACFSLPPGESPVKHCRIIHQNAIARGLVRFPPIRQMQIDQCR